MNPKISIIMGVYNCEDTLRECIDSILGQTYSNWELIICDDCSKDRTLDIVIEYSKKYPDKIKFIKNEKNITLAPTLNRCIEIATGDYIARQDGDDISINNRLEEQVKFLIENPQFDLVGTKMIVFDEYGIKGIRGVDKKIPNKFTMLEGTAFCHATILAKRRVYEKLKGYRINKYTTRCEDMDLWFRFFEYGFRGYNLDIPLYKVRDDNSAYKRRTFRNYFNVFVISLRGYMKLNIPIKYYVYLIKPLITPLIPKRIIKKYHNKKLNRNRRI